MIEDELVYQISRAGSGYPVLHGSEHPLIFAFAD
jgi:hypothetical protein